MYDQLRDAKELFQGLKSEHERTMHVRIIERNLRADLHQHLRETYGPVRPWEDDQMTAEVLKRLDAIGEKVDILLARRVADDCGVEVFADAEDEQPLAEVIDLATERQRRRGSLAA